MYHQYFFEDRDTWFKNVINVMELMFLLFLYLNRRLFKWFNISFFRKLQHLLC